MSDDSTVAVVEVCEDSKILPAPETKPSEPEAVLMNINSVQALAQRVLSISIAKELQAERLARDEQRMQQLAARITHTQIANEAHAKYVADPEANCELFCDALRTLGSGVINSKSDWTYLDPAVKHCLKQVQRGMYHAHSNAKFATWAAMVMRNKIRDYRRKLWRAQKRKARKEAKEAAQIYNKGARMMRKYKRSARFEFSSEEVKTACEQLHGKQARLLELKAANQPSQKIAKELSLSLPQLYNRWARLRKRVRQIVKPKRVWLRDANPKTRWYPGAESYTPARRAEIKR